MCPFDPWHVFLEPFRQCLISTLAIAGELKAPSPFSIKNRKIGSPFEQQLDDVGLPCRASKVQWCAAMLVNVFPMTTFTAKGPFLFF